jgi:inorganic triphosphatase YgiF
MELIVASYVKVRDRRALTDLLAHRRKVVAELQAVSGISPENAVRAVQDELAVIEAGLEALKPPPGSLPENEWS